MNKHIITIGDLIIPLECSAGWDMTNRRYWTLVNTYVTHYIDVFDLDPCKLFLTTDACEAYVRKQIKQKVTALYKELT